MSATGRGRPLLLLFYDPDCAHCTWITERLARTERLRASVVEGRLEVLTIHAGTGHRDRERWRKTLGRILAAWTAGYNGGSLHGKELYVPRELPALYLLDAERRMAAKEPSPERLGERIREIGL